MAATCQRPRRVGLGQVVGVAAGAVAGQLADDLGPARHRPLQALQHDDAGALGRHEAVAVDVERAAGALGRVVAARERPRRVQARHAEGGDAGLGPARDHHVGRAPADDRRGVADAVVARRARRHHARARPAQAELHRDVAGGHVDDRHRDRSGAIPARGRAPAVRGGWPRRSRSSRCRSRSRCRPARRPPRSSAWRPPPPAGRRRRRTGWPGPCGAASAGPGSRRDRTPPPRRRCGTRDPRRRSA